MNQIAFEANLSAHHDGGGPCTGLRALAQIAYYLEQLFYFFEYACFVSGTPLGVNLFDQPGVEAYKKNMFVGLGNS